MSPTDNDIDWSLTGWEGSRRAQLRQWLALTVRERLQAIEEMVELSARIADSLRSSECNAPEDIPASAADTGTGVPNRSGVLPRVDQLRSPQARRTARAASYSVVTGKHMPAGGETHRTSISCTFAKL